ncbi:TonB-dependent receptor [uncultured Paraglaciecola sp.]|uniref:TonB-dependent receptor n=1 Tax=uncultured Paraglaciecola sp. TaxID=1765024 RepID=UPI00261E9F15|nr:TonB-dependent receptor [uncultured Paraglaciecola sp.]
MRVKTRLAALIGAALSPYVLAQSIEGTVQTQSGTPIIGAKVEIEGAGTTTTTDQSGKFVFTAVSQGLNEIHIKATGFSHMHRDIKVSGNEVVSHTFVATRTPIEVIDVSAYPIHLSSMESAIPVSVLGGETLRRQQAPTLGDTLEKLPGVHTNFHGKVSSTPIIRGLGGPRVLITQNGLDVSDVSRVGPDHSVSSEASTAQQIEVLRGSATLFYGSGAIGGVVNVVDQRVPTSSDTQGEWLLEHSSVDEQKSASFNATTGTKSLAFYADGFYRESDDYEVPVQPELESDGHVIEHDNKTHFKVANSAEESNGFTLGTSYLFEQGYAGISVEQFNREYGVPGHAHGEEDEHDDHGHNETAEHEAHSDDVFADLEQTKIQLLSELVFADSFINGANFRAGFTDYKHAEIEAGEVGTTFENSTQEVRLELLHQPYAGFKGGLSFHYKNSEVAAQGNEAFTPPSDTEMIALAVMEERHFDKVLLQFGGRIERVTLKTDELILPMIAAHSQESEQEEDYDGHDTDDHSNHGSGNHSDEAQVPRIFSSAHKFTPISLSAGAVWDFAKDYNLGISISHSQRAPSASELLSFGPHIGTQTYEVGALFAVHHHDGEVEFELSDNPIDLETANNIDLTLRKTQGDIGFIFNVFYNQVDNYYYQTATGLLTSSEHNDDDHDGHNHGAAEDEHIGELPVFIFQTDDVVLHGFEAQVAWQVSEEFNATVFSDLVRARLKDGGNLPRTSPIRFGTQFSYQTVDLSAHLDVTHYQSQDKVASFETATNGYTLVDVAVSYDLSLLNHQLAVYLKGHNLTDTEARVHTSFLKNLTPRPGRNFSLGIKGYF